jgi:nucleoside-diphosphate-sugar epimerase
MILVTGAAGHVGNVLVRQLIERGETVRALLLPGEDSSSLNDLPVEKVTGDVLEPASLSAAMRGVEVVYHLAAIIAILPGSEALMQRVNVEGTLNVIRAAQAAGVRRLIYTSSIHALQRPPAGVTINESLHFDISNPSGAYDRTKAAGSLEVLKAVADSVLPGWLARTITAAPKWANSSGVGWARASAFWWKVSLILSMCGMWPAGIFWPASTVAAAPLTYWVANAFHWNGCGR